MESSHTIQDPPELAGPGSYDESGAVTYANDQPDWRIGRIPPQFTPEEREREAAIVARLIDNCDCGPIPGGVLTQLGELVQRARVPSPEGTGCPRCRPIPAALISELADAIETGAQR